MSSTHRARTTAVTVLAVVTSSVVLPAHAHAEPANEPAVPPLVTFGAGCDPSLQAAGSAIAKAIHAGDVAELAPFVGKDAVSGTSITAQQVLNFWVGPFNGGKPFEPTFTKPIWSVSCHATSFSFDDADGGTYTCLGQKTSGGAWQITMCTFNDGY